MLSGKSNHTMHNVIKEIKPNDALSYQENQTKRCVMLSGKSYQTMDYVIRKIKQNNA